MPAFPSRVILAALTAAALAATTPVLAAAPHSTSGPQARSMSGPKVFLWSRAGRPAAPPDTMGANNLIYHGGSVQHRPHVYLTFWGSEWKSGFHAGPGSQYSQKTVMTYETQFFAHVGGSAWHGVQSQFCDGIQAGATSCGELSPSHFVQNNRDVLRGVWVDPSPAPATIATTGLAQNLVTDPVATEALAASQHFHSSDPDATFFVFTPPGHAATAYGSVYCAYHSQVTKPGGVGIRYSFMPYTPEQGAGCGGNSVNRTNDSFGHGYLDSYTLAGGHEFEEAVTDPDNLVGVQDGWNDVQTSENGDKCAYFHAANLTLGRLYFAVQPMWSNEANHGSGGCAMRRGTGSFPIPPLTPVGP